MVGLDRERLIRIAGLLTSDKMGERAAAAAKASDMLRAAGMTWRDVLSHTQGAPRVLLIPADTSEQDAEIARLRASLAASEAHRRALAAQLQAERSVFWTEID
ncbi:hypothetical protein D3218_19105 [Aureimonas flava]|uniref:Uncharacterized protein n=1 Tax=Aureimonas flava TaxID=2320271 RepID=A0A3A1WGD1_9HYPH|nr:hypothetical protein [Aureimonas flava]RIX97170.1 hypothetical protein D3218_19105 [Aureimonas flava]